MEIYKAQIVFERSQLEALIRIAEEESRSLSEVVREMIDRELRYRQRRQTMLAARELRSDYNTDPVLAEFTSLDHDNFLFEDNENEKG